MEALKPTPHTSFAKTITIEGPEQFIREGAVVNVPNKDATKVIAVDVLKIIARGNGRVTAVVQWHKDPTAVREKGPTLKQTVETMANQLPTMVALAVAEALKQTGKK